LNGFQTPMQIRMREVASAQADVQTLKALVDQMVVVAPADSQVFRIPVEDGEFVLPGVPLISLVDLHDMWVQFDLREDLLRDLKVGSRIDVRIPALGVSSKVMRLGLASDGTMQVPPLFGQPSEAGWYEYSPTPGQPGPSVIVGHVDTYRGPSVFYRLGAGRPGEEVDVGLADGTTAVFRVTGVREYSKSSFPSRTVYGPTSNAALRLITCGGDFDPATRHYLGSTVVFASLVSGRPS